MEINKFIKEKRQSAHLTQPQIAEKAGVGLRFIRELEQGKETLRLDKVNQVLKLFGYKVGAVEMIREQL
jgi:y4mF family transcriptional regulator